MKFKRKKSIVKWDLELFGVNLVYMTSFWWNMIEKLDGKEKNCKYRRFIYVHKFMTHQNLCAILNGMVFEMKIKPLGYCLSFGMFIKFESWIMNQIKQSINKHIELLRKLLFQLFLLITYVIYEELSWKLNNHGSSSIICYINFFTIRKFSWNCKGLLAY